MSAPSKVKESSSTPQPEEPLQINMPTPMTTSLVTTITTSSTVTMTTPVVLTPQPRFSYQDINVMSRRSRLAYRYKRAGRVIVVLLFLVWCSHVGIVWLLLLGRGCFAPFSKDFLTFIKYPPKIGNICAINDIDITQIVAHFCLLVVIFFPR